MASKQPSSASFTGRAPRRRRLLTALVAALALVAGLGLYGRARGYVGVLRLSGSPGGDWESAELTPDVGPYRGQQLWWAGSSPAFAAAYDRAWERYEAAERGRLQAPGARPSLRCERVTFDGDLSWLGSYGHLGAYRHKVRALRMVRVQLASITLPDLTPASRAGAFAACERLKERWRRADG